MFDNKKEDRDEKGEVMFHNMDVDREHYKTDGLYFHTKDGLGYHIRYSDGDLFDQGLEAVRKFMEGGK